MKNERIQQGPLLSVENLGDVRAERAWGARAETALSLFFVGLHTDFNP